jgi:hypothetical protein
MSLPSSSSIRKSGNVQFLAVARAKPDRVIVASLACQRNQTEDAFFPAVREVLQAPDFARKVLPGARYRLTSAGNNAFSFTCDGEQRIYILISTDDYPERLAFQLINELVNRFQDLAPTALTCSSGALDSKARRIFQALASEYDDPTKLDKLSLVQEQVAGVHATMHKNVDQMLRNIDSATRVEDKSRDLQESALQFNTNANALKRMELCRKYKITACIVLAVIVLILIIVLTLVGPGLGAQQAVSPSGSPPTTPPPTSSTEG